MPDLLIFSFDAAAMALLSCIALREVFVFALPDQIAGPGGWFIDTNRKG